MGRDGAVADQIRILVVDNDETSIQSLRDMLGEYDFEVEDVRDSRKVLDHLRQTNDYSLLILDINMPHKDGVTLASQVRNTLHYDTPILFVSADISKTNLSRIRRMSLGGHTVEFLKKGSFNSEILFNVAMALIKERISTNNVSEIKGRVSKMQKSQDEIKETISDFILKLEDKPLVSIDHCKAQSEELVKSLRKEVIGITLGEASKKLDEALKPEPLAVRIGAALTEKPQAIEPALEPNLMFAKTRQAAAWKMAVYFLLVIFAGLCIFWGNMWTKADHADDGVRKLEIQQKQVIDTMQQQTTAMKSHFRRLQKMFKSNPSMWVTTKTHP